MAIVDKVCLNEYKRKIMDDQWNLEYEDKYELKMWLCEMEERLNKLENEK